MSATIARVRGSTLLLHPMRLVKLVLGLLAFLVYVWIAAVRAVPNVKLRKAAFREEWAARRRARRGDTWSG
jgi:hypothetical protein